MSDLKIFLKTNDLKLNLTNVKLKFICQICGNLLCTPVQAECCCRFCEKCILDRVSDCTMNCSCGKGTIERSTLSKDYSTKAKLDQLEFECPNGGCDQIFKCIDLLAHLQVCPKTKVACCFSTIGCDCPKSYLEQREQQTLGSIVKHSCLVADVIKNFENEIVEIKENENKTIEKMEHISGRLENGLDDIYKNEVKEKIDNLKADVDTKEEKIENLKQELSTNIAELKMDCTEKERIDKLEKENEELKKNDKKKDTLIKKMNERMYKLELQIALIESKNQLQKGFSNASPIVSVDTDEYKYKFLNVSTLAPQKPYTSHTFAIHGYYFQFWIFPEKDLTKISAALLLVNIEQDDTHRSAGKWPMKNPILLGVLDEDDEQILANSFCYNDSADKTQYDIKQVIGGNGHLFIKDSQMNLNPAETLVNDNLTLICHFCEA